MRFSLTKYGTKIAGRYDEDAEQVLMRKYLVFKVFPLILSDFLSKYLYDQIMKSLVLSFQILYTNTICNLWRCRKGCAVAREEMDTKKLSESESERFSLILKAIMNNLEAAILVVNPRSKEVIFSNIYTKTLFDIKEIPPGMRCYELLHGYSKPCEPCLYEQAAHTGKITQRIFHHPSKERVYRITSMLMDWPGLDKVYLEFGIDITDNLQQQEMLKSILNGMDALITVCTPQDGKILFLNDSIRKYFNIASDGVGQTCYRLLQHRDEPCESCPYLTLMDNPEQTLTWEHHEAVNGSILHKTARFIDWPSGKKAHLEYAIDITELRRTQEELEQREKTLDVLNKMSLILLRRDDASFSSAMNEGIGLVAGIADIDRVSVFRNFMQADILHFSQLYRWHKQVGSIVNVRDNLVNVSYCDLSPRWEEVLSSDQYISGLAGTMPEADLLRTFGCVSILAVPIFDDGKFWGFVLYEKLVEENFTPHEIDILRSSGFVLANAVIRHHESAIIREANERVKLMIDATPYACFLWDQNGLLIDCNEVAMGLFGFTEKVDSFSAFLACSPEYQPDGQRSDEASIHWIDKAFEEGRCDFEWMHQKLDGTPIPSDVTLVRVLYGDGPVVIGYSHDLRLVRKMEKSILRLESEVEKVYHDPLTSIYSRRFFDENIVRLIHSLSRSIGLLSLMMIDIDYFKQYNDTYGHIKGDECLKAVASTLQNCTMRKEDFVARYGGEEFVVILPNTNASGAHLLAEKMLESIRSHHIPHEASETSDRVTISIGLVTGRVRRTHNRDDYLKRADEMLYAAKERGRNCFMASILA